MNNSAKVTDGPAVGEDGTWMLRRCGKELRRSYTPILSANNIKPKKDRGFKADSELE